MKAFFAALAMLAFAGAASACPFSAAEQAEAPIVKPAPTS
jgi:hypothetical protein